MKLALLADSGDILLADEYTPEDGRVHLMGLHRYATFYKSTDMSLEYDKVSIPIYVVLYEAVDWPVGAVDKSYLGLRAYFLGEHYEDQS